MVPGKFTLQQLVSGRITFNTASGQQRSFGHHELRAAAPDSRQIVGRVREIRLLGCHKKILGGIY
jgi:hypothetical protein